MSLIHSIVRKRKRNKPIETTVSYTFGCVHCFGVFFYFVHLYLIFKYSHDSKIVPWPVLEWWMCSRDLQFGYAHISKAKKRSVCKWSGFQVGSEIQKPNHLKTNHKGWHLVFAIWNLHYLLQILNPEKDFERLERANINKKYQIL